MNGSDCGMFTCKYAEYITKDKPITFTQVGLLIDASEVCVVGIWFFYFILSFLEPLWHDAFFFFLETHAVFQEADGVGDLKPETFAIRQCCEDVPGKAMTQCSISEGFFFIF